MRRILEFLSKLLAFALVLGVPAALAWLQFVGFNESWRMKVAEALSGPAHTVHIGQLKFDVFSGIVAEQVDVEEPPPDGRRLAEIDRLVLALNLADLLRGHVKVERLKLDNAEVAIPFADDGRKPDSVVMTELNADIVNTGGQITINRMDLLVHGVRVRVGGQFLNPEGLKLQPAKPPENPEERIATIRSVLEQMETVEFRGAPAELYVELEGDVSDSATIAAPVVRFRSRETRYRNLSFDRLLLDGSYADGTARLTRLRASGESGRLHASGSWSMPTRTGQMDLRGSMQVDPLLAVTGRQWLEKDLSFEGLPSIDLSITFSPKEPKVLAIGHLSTGSFRYKDIHVKSAEADVAWKEDSLFIQDATVVSETGRTHVDALVVDENFQVKLASDAIPTEFDALVGPKERQILDLMEFDENPRVTLSLYGDRSNMKSLRGNGHIRLGRTAMRGSWIDSGESAIEFEDRAVLYRDFTLRKDGEQATGSFTYDFGRREVRIDDVNSTLDPPAVLMWIDPRIAATVAVYRFRGAPDVHVDGLVHMADPAKNDLRIEVDAPAGLKYELLKKDLPFGATEATVRLKGRRVLADVRRAELFGGEAAIDVSVSIAREDPGFGADVTVSGVNFSELTGLYFGYSKSEGVMSGSYDFTASLRQPASMKGSGSIRVEEGHVLAIPLFGPLSEIIGKIIPGVGHESARLATADFTIANQEISTQDLKIEGQGFELFGDGKVGFPGGEMDLTVRINARGVPGLVLFPVSKLFEYVSTGTVSNPQWRPKIVPREFFDILGMGGRKESR